MTCGAHHHLKRLAAPNQWGLEKEGGKYAVRPLPGPHNKDLSIPLKYIIERFLKVANTAKETEYIVDEKMIWINGREVSSTKFPVGLFDVITLKKPNLHYRLYLGATKKFKLHKISSEEARFRLSKVISKYEHAGIPMTHTMDGYNFKFSNPAININDTVKIDIATNKIVDNFSLGNGKLGYVYSGPSMGKMGTIVRIETDISEKTTIYLQDANEKVFSTSINNVMTVGETQSPLITFDEKDGIRLNAYELSNLRYAVQKEQVEDN
ncbi:40S ribosomal protein S4 [Glugoides intestinalis]